MQYSQALVTLALALVAALNASMASASIHMSSELDIDFTNEKDAQKKAAWSPADKLSISSEGLGWAGEPHASYDGWIQTKPQPIGLSWRPTSGVAVSIEIQPAMSEVTLPNGQKYTRDAGDVYLRYSPDLKHWSSWQVLQRGRNPNDRRQMPAARYYHGSIRVSYRDQQAYHHLLSKYSALDVPWKSDEEAAVRWIIGHDPDFFAEQIPFMGYVEFLVEQGFPGGQRVKSFKARLGCGVSGLHIPPTDPAAYKDRDIPWRFVAEGIEEDPSDAPAGAPMETSPEK